MKWFANPCGRLRQSLSLLAAGALPPQEEAAVERHLAACPDCRLRFAELMETTALLADWEKRCSSIRPDSDMRVRWQRAIHRVAADQSSQLDATRFSWRLLWRELIFPCRRIWTGLAAVWLGLLIFNHSQAQPSQPVLANGKPAPAEIRMALLEQRRVLNELIGPKQSEQPAEPPRRQNNQPRSERRSVAMG